MEETFGRVDCDEVTRRFIKDELLISMCQIKFGECAPPAKVAEMSETFGRG